MSFRSERTIELLLPLHQVRNIPPHLQLAAALLNTRLLMHCLFEEVA